MHNLVNKTSLYFHWILVATEKKDSNTSQHVYSGQLKKYILPWKFLNLLRLILCKTCKTISFASLVHEVSLRSDQSMTRKN